MKIQITLTVDDEGVTAEDVQALLFAAIDAYEEPRTPVDRYVAQKHRDQSDAMRARKAAEITKRVKLAHKIRQGIIRGEIKLEPWAG